MIQRKYVDIERLKSAYVDAFTKGENITVSEKVDGSNASICYDPDTNKVVAFSRRQQLNEKNTLQGFYEWTQKFSVDDIREITENGRYIIFGEWLVKNKIKYPDEMYHRFYMFDVKDSTTDFYLPIEKVEEIYNKLLKIRGEDSSTLTMAPIFYKGTFIDWTHIQSFVGKTELNAEPCGEGVVIKSQDRLNDTPFSRRPKYVKLVSEKFAEVQKTKKPIDPEVLKKVEAQRELAATIVTRRRVEKTLARMVEDGIIPVDWNETNMKDIARNINTLVYQDCIKEESEVVEQIENFGKICGSITMKFVREILNERNAI